MTFDIITCVVDLSSCLRPQERHFLPVMSRIRFKGRVSLLLNLHEKALSGFGSDDYLVESGEDLSIHPLGMEFLF